jgi:hypothetical protein
MRFGDLKITQVSSKLTGTANNGQLRTQFLNEYKKGEPLTILAQQHFI